MITFSTSSRQNPGVIVWECMVRERDVGRKNMKLDQVKSGEGTSKQRFWVSCRSLGVQKGSHNLFKTWTRGGPL